MSKKVLVVDGEEVIRKLLRIHLAKLGYEVEEAADGAEALEQLGNEYFDFLILDILIPNEDGWQILKEVKSNLKIKDIPIIILTAKNGDSDMIKGYAMGASYYITKPFTRAQLLYGIQLMSEEKSESLLVGRQE